MRSLDHPNLMKIEGVFETENSIYFVVEYLKGGLLYDMIKRRHQFTT
jgi:serine/threonine protein kinase